MKLSLCASLTLICLLTCGMDHRGPAPPGPEQGGGWRLYIPPDRSFSVEAPCDMKQKNVSATSKPIYEYDCMIEDAPGLSFFVVSVVEMSDAERARMRDEAAFERSVRESFPPNRRLVRLTPLKVEGGFGREVVLTNARDGEDNSRGLVIIYGGRRYDVGYLATDMKELESPTAERFFASFKPLR